MLTSETQRIDSRRLLTLGLVLTLGLSIIIGQLVRLQIKSSGRTDIPCSVNIAIFMGNPLLLSSFDRPAITGLYVELFSNTPYHVIHILEAISNTIVRKQKNQTKEDKP